MPDVQRLPKGTVVTPIDPVGDPKENIVGIVASGNSGLAGMSYVVWFSDKRGVFACYESPTDLVAGSLSDRDESPDVHLDHMRVAQVLQWEAAPR